ncbi:hypothetical protein CPB83DRAFT_909430 [Crepidotus variabilis]|uniref:Aip3p/Bud6 N-terminal domain-containing protein n=1 Tax=Crepidotus variabilis TaxID=179855 RepID=A0A9P6E9W2_9AGAR|nr:hypothetical protein CPB83DRAFT_909430 [Crepidotus variabilis]
MRSESPATRAVDSSVTRLLTLTKQLLSVLNDWPEDNRTEEDVRKASQDFHDGFIVAVKCFGQFNISLQGILSVPNEVSDGVEVILAGERTRAGVDANFEIIRSPLRSLLNGLRPSVGAWDEILLVPWI